jgi:endo-1,4-beta-xylanase
MTFRLALISIVLVGTVSSAHATPTPLARCEKVKLAAAGATALHLLKCHAKAVRTGTPIDIGCITASSGRLSTTFHKAEASNLCPFTGEAAAVASALIALAGNLTGATGGGPSVCGGKKILAAARRVQAELKAQAKYALALDPEALGSALAVADARFSAGFASAEGRGDCVTVSDAPAVASRSDSASADVVDVVRGTLATLGARSGRLIGTAVRANVLESMEPAYRDTILRQFDYVTAEYEFMWGNLEPVRGSYQFGPVDTIVGFAQQHALRLKGAPLVWHLILPPWVNETMTPAELQSAVDQRIDTLMATYAGKVAVWDVVNEATIDGGAAYRDSLFLQKLGPDYIRNAFVRARQADPTALLFYNDFLADGVNAKSDFIYQMVVDLLAQGTPIDGVSFQMHLGGGFGAAPLQSSVIQNLQRFADLGLRVHISEMDVQIGGAHPVIPGGIARQRDIYHDMVAACLAVAGCDSATFWGFTDKYTWIKDYLGVYDQPLPFDVAYRPKPAFFGARDALVGF